jgi:predicted extracellular nuclease
MKKAATTSVFLGAAALALATPAFAVSPDIVISQVYGGGGNSGATLTNDFIEIFNRGVAAVDVTGWSVQYASASGSTWQVTALSGVIPAGGYYLIQEAQGAGGSQALPTPDATGTIAMSATNGKIALVTNSTALSGTCPAAYDFLGYGSANCSETSATLSLNNTTAVLRNADGCTETDNNSSDFTLETPAPRNSASPDHNCNPVQNTSSTWGRMKTLYR